MHTGNVNKVRVIAAIAIVTALVTTTSLTMTIAPDVYAYKKYQAASQASACGNDEVPINVGCQNIYSQIQGNENVVSLTAQQTFPASVTPSPSPPPPPPTATKYEFLEEFAPSEQFSNPDITIDEQTGNIYVADYFNNRVVKLDPSGDVITQWGSEGSGNGQFHNPQDVAIDSSGKVYVTDTHNHRIQKFDSNGQFILKWGTQGSGHGQLAFPSRLAFDSNDILYVTEPDNGRVQKFDTNGQFVGTIAEGQLSFPVGIDLDSDDNVYVAESGASGNPSRVDKFTSSGQFITSWGSLGPGVGQFNQPKGLTLDANDDVYVADEFNNRIQKFDSDGNFITEFGQDRLFHPIDVAVDSQGRVYASDFDEILIYIPIF